MDKKDIDTHLSMKTGQNMDKTGKHTLVHENGSFGGQANR